MKRLSKNLEIKYLDIKLFAMLMAGCMVSAGIKSCVDEKKNSTNKIQILDEVTCSKDVEKEASHRNNSEVFSYTYQEIEPVSDEYYRSIIIDGRTLNFANTPTPTPAPNNDLIDAYTDEQITGEDGIYPEGYFEYQEQKEHSLNFKTIEEMISFYSKVFELNEDVSTSVINSVIGNKSYSLDTEVVINDTRYNSLEEAIARYLYDLSENPSYYGYSEEDVRSTDGYMLDYYLPEELIYKYSKVLDVNPYIAMAIAYGESGRKLDSFLFVNYHNAGGIVGSNGFAYYKNEAEGLYRFVQLLHDRYFVTSESDYSRIKIMANGYCEDSSYWIGLVGSIYFELCDYGYASTYNDYRYAGRDLIYCDEEEVSFYRSKYYNG